MAKELSRVNEIYDDAIIRAKNQDEIDKLEFQRTLQIQNIEDMRDQLLGTLILPDAGNKWDLEYILVKHRFGRLKINDNIVLVITSSKHRKNAYEASEFIMEYLKSNVPFWKKEVADKTQKWVDNS